jgi:hypothetical protein
VPSHAPRPVRLALISGILIAAAAGAAAQAPSKPASVAGKWTVTLETESFTATSAIELKQDSEKITGTYTSTRYGAVPLEGKIKERAIEFAFKLNVEGTEVPMSYAGEVAADGQTMKGKASLGDMGAATWSAKRAPQ